MESVAQAYGLIHIGLAIACSILAKQKKRNAVGWFFLGLLGSVISIIILMILEPAQNYDEYKLCPYCYEKVKREAIVCKHCGGEMEPGVQEL